MPCSLRTEATHANTPHASDRPRRDPRGDRHSYGLELELELFYQLKGFSVEESRRMAEQIAREPKQFLKALVQEELGLSEETFPNLRETLNQFQGGLAQYRKGDFDRAIRGFQEALALHPGDKLSQTYIDRCNYLKAHPVEGEWDGVWVMKSK